MANEKPGDQAPAKPAADAAADTGKKPGEGATPPPADDKKKPDAGAGAADDKAPPAAGEKKTPPDGKAADAGAEGAPESYSLTVPKGAEAYLDAADLKVIETRARARGLTNDEAQDAIEEYADELAEQSAGFRTETEGHKTLGGEHLAETQRLVTRVMNKYAPEGDPLGVRLRKLLAKSGHGNELSVVNFLARIGKDMAEDTPDQGGLGGKQKAADRSAAEILYDHTPAGKT